MKRIIFIVIIIFCCLSIIHAGQSMYSMWQKKDLLVKAHQRLEKQEKERDSLKKQLQVAQNPAFVEQEARNKLFLTKPGENTVLISKDLFATPSALTLHGEKLPNWQQWLGIFHL